MNEGIAVFLNFEKDEIVRQEPFIKKIDDLLLPLGIKYSGFKNIYRPIDRNSRDHAVYAAVNTLESTPWLKEKLDHISIMHHTSACSLRDIRLDNMTRPAIHKLRYYEAYYRTSHTLAHGIVVDENRQMRDGYTSYIIARKYGIRPDIYEAFSVQPLQKVVRGRHIAPSQEGWKIRNSNIYSWNYLLKKPVVPGDILKVQTKKGQEFICVDMVDYVTGAEFCEKHSIVIKHTGKRFSQ